MDPHTFDSLARAFSSGHSRRRLLTRFAGGALAAAGAALGLGHAEAAFRCRAEGVACAKNADCCSQFCHASATTGRPVCTVVVCQEPSGASSYGGSCYGATETCTPEGMILSAQCQVANYPWNYVSTSINVNSCQPQSDVISNCNGVLTCGNC